MLPEDIWPVNGPGPVPMPELKFIGGAVCLDFINTVGGRISTEPRKRSHDYADIILREKLRGFEDFLAWSRLAGILSPQQIRRLSSQAAAHPGRAKRTLRRATRLREALYRILKSHMEGWQPAPGDVRILAREMAIARRRERLVRGRDAFVWLWDDPGALDAPLWQITKSAADLLTSRDLARLRQCGGKECGWMFLDTSRNHSRRWCDMKDCGNRAKVRSFRRRLRRRGEVDR